MKFDQERIIALFKDRKFTVSVVIVVVASFIFWLFVWSSLNSHIASANATNQADQTQIANLEVALQQAKQSTENIGPSSAKLASFEQAVPKTEDLRTFLIELDSLAATTNVDLTQVSAQAASSGGSTTPTTQVTAPGAPGGSVAPITIVKEPVQFTIEGNEAAALAFITDIYNPALLPRLLVINSYTVSQAGTPGAGDVSVNFNATMFYQ